MVRASTPAARAGALVDHARRRRACDPTLLDDEAHRLIAQDHARRGAALNDSFTHAIAAPTHRSRRRHYSPALRARREAAFVRRVELDLLRPGAGRDPARRPGRTTSRASAKKKARSGVRMRARRGRFARRGPREQVVAPVLTGTSGARAPAPVPCTGLLRGDAADDPRRATTGAGSARRIKFSAARARRTRRAESLRAARSRTWRQSSPASSLVTVEDVEEELPYEADHPVFLGDPRLVGRAER